MVWEWVKITRKTKPSRCFRSGRLQNRKASNRGGEHNNHQRWGRGVRCECLHCLLVHCHHTQCIVTNDVLMFQLMSSATVGKTETVAIQEQAHSRWSLQPMVPHCQPLGWAAKLSYGHYFIWMGRPMINCKMLFSFSTSEEIGEKLPLKQKWGFRGKKFLKMRVLT